MTNNPGWHLKSFPVGMPESNNRELRKSDVPLVDSGQILVQAQRLSVDPNMRGRISPAKNYTTGMVPAAFVRMMKGENFGKQLVKF